MDIVSRNTIGFDETHNHFITQFRLLQRAWMRLTLKRDQRLIEAICLPVRSVFAPIAGMTGNTKPDFVSADILRALIGVTAARPGRTNECQPDRSIIRLVRTILAVGENCRAEGPALICKIDPLVRADLKLPFGCVRSLNRTDVPVVGCKLVCCRERERGL